MASVVLSPDSLERFNEIALIVKQIYDQTPQIAASLGVGGLAKLIHASIKEFTNSPMTPTRTHQHIAEYSYRITNNVTAIGNIVTTIGLGGLVATQFQGDFENYLTNIGLALLSNYLASQPVNRLMRHI